MTRAAPPDNLRMAAVQAWKDLLGSDRALTEPADLQPYLENVSAWEGQIPLVLKPNDVEEVQAILRIAAEHRFPVYPISTGCNWGMGSKLPPRDAAVLDLSGMNRILEINVEHQYAVIEPGVTQGQLVDEIRSRGLPLILNVTGSGRNTSLIGNALERGVGYFRSRVDALSGLQVVLANGDCIETGFGHFKKSLITHVAPQGVGPSLDGFFSQSNMGVVTRAGFRLLPRPEVQGAINFRLADEADLSECVDRLADLQRRGVIQTVIHIGHEGRTSITLEPLLYRVLRKRNPTADHAELLKQTRRILQAQKFGVWSAVTGVMGTRRMVRAALRDIRKAMRGLASVRFITTKKLDAGEWLLKKMNFLPFAREQRVLLEAVRPLFALAMGIPTDGALHSVYWPLTEELRHSPINPDEAPSGLMYVLPFMPCSGSDLLKVLHATRKGFEKYGFEPYMTYNLMEGRCIESVINLSFRRDQDDDLRRARACIEEMTQTFTDRGYIPYRVGIHSYHHLMQNQSYWSWVARLKQTLDPEGILAPGRYDPTNLLPKNEA